MATISPPELIPQSMIKTVPGSAIEVSPDLATIYYYYDGLQSIYLASSNDSKRIQNIINNKNVAITIFNATTEEDIQIKGNANVIDNNDDAITFLTFIHNAIKKAISPSHGWPLMKLNPKQVTVIRINIEQFKYSHFGEQASIIEGSSADLNEVM